MGKMMLDARTVAFQTTAHKLRSGECARLELGEGMFMREQHALSLAQAALGCPLKELVTTEAGFKSQAAAVYAALCKALSQCVTLQSLEAPPCRPARLGIPKPEPGPVLGTSNSG